MANFISKPIWIVFLVLTTRLLGSEQFGVFVYLIAVSNIIAAFFEMGLDLQVMRSISPRKEKAGHFAGISIILRSLGVLGIIVVAGILYIFDYQYQEEYPLPLYVMGILQGIFLYILSHLRALFRSLELLKFEAISLAIEKNLIAILGLIILFTSADLYAFLTFYNAGSFVAVVVTLIMAIKLTKVRLNKIPTKAEAASILKPAFPFAIMNIIQVTYTRLGTVMLERLTGNQSWVGLYNAGSRFAGAFIVFPDTIMAAVYPVFCRVYDQRDKMWDLIQLSSRILLALAVPIGTTIFIAHYEFTALVFGDGYIEASAAIGVFGLMLIANSQVFVVGSVVSATGNQMSVNKLFGIIFLISVSAYIYFIPQYGYMAAAWITFWDQVALFLINFWVTRKFYNIGTYILNIARTLVFPIAAWFYYQSGFPIDNHILTLLLIGCWNLAGVFVMGLVKRDDLQQILKLRSKTVH